MSYTTVMYMGINLRSGQKEEHDAAGWAKILGLNTNQIAEIARGKRHNAGLADQEIQNDQQQDRNDTESV